MDASAPKPVRYKSKQSLAIILASAFLVLFYNADWLIGAIGVRPFYSIPGFVLSFTFLIGAIGLSCRYRLIPASLAAILIIFLIGGAILANIALIAVGWAAAIAVAYIPFPAVIVGLVMMFVLWFWTNSNANGFRVRLTQCLMIVLLTFMAVYVLGIGSSPAHLEFGRSAYLSYHNRQYIVDVYWGWLGDPDTLIIYECNQSGLFCKDVYRKSGHYQGQTIQLAPNENGNNLTILVAGESIDSLRPS